LWFLPLSPGGPHTAPETTTESGTVQAINNLTTEIVERGLTAAARTVESTTKTLVKYFGSLGVGILLHITHNTSEQLLPQVYRDIANSPSKNKRLAVEERLREVADSMGWLGYAPIATPTLAKKLTRLNFAHTDMDDLEGGFQPFITTWREPSALASLQATISAYDDMIQGAGAALLDLKQMNASEKPGIPKNITQVTYCLKGFKILLFTILGPDHSLSKEVSNFLNRWMSLEVRMDSALVTPDSAAQIVRWLQIWVLNWFTEQVNNPGRIEAPNLCCLLTLISNNGGPKVHLGSSTSSFATQNGNDKYQWR
jgi:hypothetical protein